MNEGCVQALTRCCSSCSNGSITGCKDEIKIISIAGNDPTTQADSEMIFKGL